MSVTRAGDDRSYDGNAVLFAQEIVGSADAQKTDSVATMTDLKFMADSP
jgi:hypothetical protein